MSAVEGEIVDVDARVRAILSEFVPEGALLDRAVRQVVEELRPTGVAEIAEILDVRKPNVRKLLQRYEVAPWEQLAVGPVYPQGAIDALRALRESDEAARASDERRRASALAKRDGG